VGHPVGLVLGQKCGERHEPHPSARTLTRIRSTAPFIRVIVSGPRQDLWLELFHQHGVGNDSLEQAIQIAGLQGIGLVRIGRAPGLLVEPQAAPARHGAVELHVPKVPVALAGDCGGCRIFFVVVLVLVTRLQGPHGAHFFLVPAPPVKVPVRFVGHELLVVLVVSEQLVSESECVFADGRLILEMVVAVVVVVGPLFFFVPPRLSDSHCLAHFKNVIERPVPLAKLVQEGGSLTDVGVAWHMSCLEIVTVVFAFATGLAPLRGRRRRRRSSGNTPQHDHRH
jgi:hypothetical protein